MAAPEDSAISFLDLKLMPDWVKQPEPARDYSGYAGEEEPRRGGDRSGFRDRERRPPSRDRDRERRPPRRDGQRNDKGGRRPERRPDRRDERRPSEPRRELPIPQVGIRFLPKPAVLENVVAQIKGGTVAYSVYALARLFLDRGERYQVRVTGSEATKLYQLGESGPIAADQTFLESVAFRALQNDFYRVEVRESEPIKGNFNSVARDRVSGVLLGPTNYHGYQPALRALYEQRYSRRMQFGDFQRQIENVSDPAVVEQWKEEARKVTTYVAKNGADSDAEQPAAEPTNELAAESAEQPAADPTQEPAADPTQEPAAESAEQPAAEANEQPAVEANPEPGVAAATFATAADAERDFRRNHLPGLIREVTEAVVDGPTSRTLPDRGLRNAIENAWTTETRSPSNTMQELTGQFRGNNLVVFRHRRGMLYVSPIRPRPLDGSTNVSDSIRAVLDTINAMPGISRKDLADKVITAKETPEETERAKMNLASDLRWLVGEGHVIEFNNGTLDLPRVRPPQPEKTGAPVDVAAATPELPASISTEAAADLPAEAPAETQSPTTLSEGETPSERTI